MEHEDIERARLEAVRQLERLDAPEGMKDPCIALPSVEVRDWARPSGPPRALKQHVVAAPSPLLPLPSSLLPSSVQLYCTGML